SLCSRIYASRITVSAPPAGVNLKNVGRDGPIPWLSKNRPIKVFVHRLYRLNSPVDQIYSAAHHSKLTPMHPPCWRTHRRKRSSSRGERVGYNTSPLSQI